MDRRLQLNMLTIHFILVILALVFFAIGAIMNPARIQAISIGLFCWLLSTVVH